MQRSAKQKNTISEGLYADYLLRPLGWSKPGEFI